MVGDLALDGYLDRLRRSPVADSPVDLLGAVAAAVARELRVDLRGATLPPPADGLQAACAPPEQLARPELLGQVYQALRPRRTRRPSGAFYTPENVAATIVDATLGPLAGVVGLRVADPAVGGGAFLLATARHLAARGADPRVVVRDALHGVDVDPTAVAVTRTALALWSGGDPPPADHVRVADALTDAEAIPAGLDAVVGNPPFLSQLASATARSAGAREALVGRFGRAAAGYADTANLFLLLALDRVRAGGRVGLVLPDSFLVARDAGPARAAAAEAGALTWLWLAGGAVFEAGVRVCAPVIEVGLAQGAVERRFGPDFAVHDPLSAPDLSVWPSWSGLVADLLGVPPAAVDGDGTLGAYCRATADFRDQYYGLVHYVFEGPETADEQRHPRLMTAGLVDPARSLWGLVTTRFAKQAYTRPRVDLARLRAETGLGPWSRARLVPKILVATQTRVLEAVVDPGGCWLASTPVITVEAAPDRLWHVAAALTSPPLTAVALRRRAGAALSSQAITLGARHLTDLPAPTPGVDWDAGAVAYRDAAAATSAEQWRAALQRCGVALCRAYRVEDPEDLIAWWSERLPPWRRGV